MKRVILYSLGLVIAIVFIFTNCEKNPIQDDIAYCDSLEAAGIIDDYTFPILPGTVEWEQLTIEQRDSVLQIPNDTLLNMCTNGLIETCFNYPLLWNCTIFEHFSTWWYWVDTHFNGIPALVERSDAPKKMLKIYLEYNDYPYADSITAFTVKRYIAAKLTHMELFLAHEEVITTFSNSDLILLGERAKNMWYIKNEYDTIDFSISATYSCYLLGRMMYFDNYEPLIQEISSNNDLNDFIQVGSYIFYYNNSYEFIMNNIDTYLLKLESK